MDVYEVLRLLQMHKSDRAIAGALGIDRKTVGKYHIWAESQRLLQALTQPEELHRRLAETWRALPPQNISSWRRSVRSSWSCANRRRSGRD